MDKLIGRKQECDELKRALKSERSEFVVLYGRRRIGKTFLIRRFFDDKYTFHFVGAHNMSKQSQIEHFREKLIDYGADRNLPEFTCWRDAFRALEKFLERSKDKRKVIFFDEMPWMDTHGSDFLMEFEYFWANWVQSRDDIFFVACGSATSWMKEKLEDNQGGLHNRITLRILLRPFYLGECMEYLKAHKFDWDEYIVTQCYMIFGGVPYYLSLLRPDYSLPQNVDNLIFRPGGNLADEFKELYNALFNKADKYIEIVKFLSTKGKGYFRSEIEENTGYSGGGLSKMLDNLERCGFISSYSQFGNKSKLKLFRLSDFYTQFYFRYVADNDSRDNHYWEHHYMDRSVSIWEGNTYEQICLLHLPQIKRGLGISGVATEASSWRFVPNKGDEKPGAQIDMVIRRADKIIHLVEMKFSETKYKISKDYEARLRTRREIFMEMTNISRGVVLSFVTPKGLADGIHSGLVHSQVTEKDLFGEE